MSTDTKEPSSRTDDGLDGMPKADREDTEQILNELDAEAQKRVDPEQPEAKKTEEDKTKIVEKPKAEGEPKEDKKPEQRREVKLMPAYIHNIQKDQWEKREKDLLAAIEAAKGIPEKKESEGQEEEPKPVTAIDPKKLEALAEKHGISVDLAKDLIDLAAQNAGVIPPEVVKQLADVKQFREEQAIATESAAFSADFDKTIIPLIKAEYGNDVSPDVIEQVREALKGLAYTPDFSKVPYDVLYKGNDQFRGVIPPKKKGAEGARGGHVQEAGASHEADGDLDLSKPLTEEQVRGLSDTQFEQYEKNMLTYEQSRK